MFSVGCTPEPGRLSQKSMRDPSSIVPSKWLNGTTLSGRNDGRAVARYTSTLARAGSVFRWKKRPRFAPSSRSHGITLLMSRLDNPEKPADPLNDHQISLFRDLRRLYRGIPASLANSSGIFFAPKAHFDLVRAGAALYGINPTQGADNPMFPVIELRARIVQVLSLARWGNCRRYRWLGRKAAHATCVGFGGIRGWLSALGTRFRQ